MVRGFNLLEGDACRNCLIADGIRELLYPVWKKPQGLGHLKFGVCTRVGHKFHSYLEDIVGTAFVSRALANVLIAVKVFETFLSLSSEASVVNPAITST